MSIMIDDEFVCDINIKVFGVGGGGGNALEYMIAKGVNNVEYISVNTDVQALLASKATQRIQIGKKKTKGRGAGSRPEVGKESAEEGREEIEAALKGATMVFISAGMGGGTGTGAAPVIAQIAKEMGILSVGVVTKPFHFEREHKMNQALKGIAEMRKCVDALVIIPNERLLSISERSIGFRDAFALADDVLWKAVKSISDLVTVTGYMNVDFADVEDTLRDAGDAHMAVGQGTGDNKAEEAAKAVINSPLLETSIKGAGRILINITMSPECTLDETEKAMRIITEAAKSNVKVITGATFNDDLKNELIVTIIATGFDGKDEAVELPPGNNLNAKSNAKDVKPAPSSKTSFEELVGSQIESSHDEIDHFTEILDLFKK